MASNTERNSPSEGTPVQGTTAVVTPPLGTYTNFMRIITSVDEFVLEFGTKLPGTNIVLVHTKLISSPTHTKRMLKAIQQNIERHEKRFGPIREPSAKATTTRQTEEHGGE